MLVERLKVSTRHLFLHHARELQLNRIPCIFQESDTSLYLPALESLRTLIKTSTSSMTAVPKPLKFLRPFYQELISTFEGFDEKKLENERVSAEKSSLSAT